MTTNILFDDKTVLLVEDDLVVAENVAGDLNALGFLDVLTATTLSQSQEILENNSIDVAVLDVNLMGGKTTHDLAWALAADGVPVLFFSGVNADEIARSTRGHEFMEKPISLPRLKAALQRAIVRSPGQPHHFVDKKMAGRSARQ